MALPWMLPGRVLFVAATRGNEVWRVPLQPEVLTAVLPDAGKLLPLV